MKWLTFSTTPTMVFSYSVAKSSNDGELESRVELAWYRGIKEGYWVPPTFFLLSHITDPLPVFVFPPRWGCMDVKPHRRRFNLSSICTDGHFFTNVQNWVTYPHREDQQWKLPYPNDESSHCRPPTLSRQTRGYSKTYINSLTRGFQRLGLAPIDSLFAKGPIPYLRYFISSHLTNLHNTNLNPNPNPSLSARVEGQQLKTSWWNERNSGYILPRPWSNQNGLRNESTYSEWGLGLEKKAWSSYYIAFLLLGEFLWLGSETSICVIYIHYQWCAMLLPMLIIAALPHRNRLAHSLMLIRFYISDSKVLFVDRSPWHSRMSVMSNYSHEENGNGVPPIPFPFVPYGVQRELMKKVLLHFNFTLVSLPLWVGNVKQLRWLQ